MKQKDSSTTISELQEWQTVYQEAQNLLHQIRLPHEFLLAWSYQPDSKNLDNVAKHWQNSCLPKLKELQLKIEQFEYARSFILENLRTYVAKDITKKFRTIEVESSEFEGLYFHFNEFKEILFQVLNIADKRIMVLTVYSQKNRSV